MGSAVSETAFGRILASWGPVRQVPTLRRMRPAIVLEGRELGQKIRIRRKPRTRAFAFRVKLVGVDSCSGVALLSCRTITAWHRRLLYESNPRHRIPWQRGRRGSRCPNSIRSDLAQTLLSNSAAIGGKRYAVHEGRAYCAQEHRADVWHGYPVGWKEVPEKLRREWLDERSLQKRDIKNHWDG